MRAVPPGAPGAAAVSAALGDACPPPMDAFEPTIFLYDHYSGGIGLAEALHPRFPDLLQGSRDRIAACACRDGCPSCVGPVQEVGPRAKALALDLLDRMIDRARPIGAPLSAIEEPDPVPHPTPDAFEP